MGRTYAAFLLLLAPAIAGAYTPTITSKGLNVRWGETVSLELVGNPGNQSAIAADDFKAAVVRGLKRWSSASGGSVDFEYWQGTDTSVYEPNSEYNGVSSIYFASNANGDTNLSAYMIGLTQVWYSTDTGQIYETDVVLNDKDYRFTTDPKDTSGYGTLNRSTGAERKVFIENVITHELGHAFGLSHSGGLQSTMLFMESPEQAHLGCDEHIGIRAVYPADDASARGAISGRILSEDGRPIFGAHVVAISRRRGTVLASGITAADGKYSIAALEPGEYLIFVEPFYAGAGSLPSYYSAVTSDMCGGKSFGRTFLGDGLELRSLSVKPGGTASAGDLVARCGTHSGDANVASSGSASAESAHAVFRGGSGGFGAVDRVNTIGESRVYRLQGIGGTVELHALAYSIYSPAQAKLRLLDVRGEEVGAEVREQVYSGASGFVNYDSSIRAEDLPVGDYYLEVSTSALDPNIYPAGPVSIDRVPYFVITGSIGEAAPVLSDTLAFNARCQTEDQTAEEYRSPATAPIRDKSEEGDDEEGGFLGGCGTLRDGSSGSSGGQGPNSMAIVGWFIPWMVMLAYFRVQRLRVFATSHRLVS